MTPPAPARVDGVLATKAARAVIFRRGSSDVVQQLLWNLDTDEIQPGQWIRAHVYTRRCDLSPDGRHLVGFFSDFSPRRMEEAARQYGLGHGYEAEAWTALSVPPYFTALALWFQSDTYYGGGRWISERAVEIHHPFTRHEAIAPPKKITAIPVSNNGAGQGSFIWHARLRDRGWKMIHADAPGTAVAWEKTVANGRLVYQSTRLDRGNET